MQSTVSSSIPMPTQSPLSGEKTPTRSSPLFDEIRHLAVADGGTPLVIEFVVADEKARADHARDPFA